MVNKCGRVKKKKSQFVFLCYLMLYLISLVGLATFLYLPYKLVSNATNSNLKYCGGGGMHTVLLLGLCEIGFNKVCVRNV